jgi:hypothetical protein
MQKVIFVFVFFGLFLSAFAALPAPPITTSLDSAQIIQQIQQTQTMVVQTSEALGTSIAVIGSDVNGMKQDVAALEKQNAELKAQMATFPSASTVLLGTLAANVLMFTFIVGLKKKGMW